MCIQHNHCRSLTRRPNSQLLAHPAPSFSRSYNDGTGRVALYRFPKRRIKGTCIFVHGCKHDPFSWFYKSRGCPMCTGGQR